MMLRRLELQAFGRFNDEVIEFAPGLNLVSGPNESGKTTLVQAVSATLFGVDDVTRFVPRDRSGTCRAALVLETGGRRIRVERDFLSGRVEWSEEDSDGDFQRRFCGFPDAKGADADRAAFLVCLQDVPGVCSRDRFEPPVCGDAAVGVAGICAERLKACLGDGDAGVFGTILEDLRSEYQAIAGADAPAGEAGAGGELEAIARRLGALEREWFALQEIIRRTEHGKDGEAGKGPPGEGEETEALADQQEGAPQEAAGVGPEDEAVEISAPIDMPENPAPEARAALEAELAKTGLPREIPEALPGLLDAYGELRQVMAEHKRALGARREERRRCRMPALKMPVAGLAGIAAATWAWSRMQSGALPYGGALLATAAVAGWHAHRCLQVRKDLRERDRQIHALEEQVGEHQDQLADLNERFEALGLSPSPVEMVRMQKNLARHRQLLDLLRQEEGTGSSGAGDTGGATAAEPHDGAASPAAAPGSNDMEVAPSAAMPAEEISGPDTAGAPDDGMQAGENIADLDSLLDARSRIEAEGEVLRHREAELKRRRDTLRVACDLLTDTLDGASGPDRNDFIRILNRTLADLTAGLIEKVHVSEDYRVFLPGPDGSPLPPECCSGATRTLLQLALCLALNGLRDEPARLPLLLDDPLGNLDKKRRNGVMKVLENCADGQQVILFSHEEGLRRRALREGWHLLSLRTAGSPVTASSEEKNDDDGQLSFL
jgi:energy-coupling factor transporter ATP-binding protein EcfA2